jgi:4a-hydroxytetrahydrobiopterin dehydratase
MTRTDPAHPAWRRLPGDVLVREMQLRDFDAAMHLVRRVAEAAEDHLRRPDMCITEFNRVRFTIANLHHAGLTQAELRLLEKVDRALEADPLATEV